MIPKVGDIITRRQGEKLCRHFGMYREANRIASRPEAYRKWEFDGCTGLPDVLLRRLHLMGWQWQAVTLACLKHDLRYAYGIPGDKHGRLFADRELRTGLAKVIPGWAAWTFYAIVRVGGAGFYGTDYSWSFAVR